jgi:asparagine synthase (glutamine-hydrolysing)
MCGIAGYFLPDLSSTKAQVLCSMLRSIAHRGPDDEGFVLIDASANRSMDLAGAQSDPRIRAKLPLIEASAFEHDIGFAHRRYSIVDLSPAGHQPMWSGCGNVNVSFNGEIYNYVELRSELEKLGHRFQSTSDTEVILAGYVEWSTAVFTRLNGPFAISLYDKTTKRLLLARDRLGKSPLYYTSPSQGLFWASEIKALLTVFGTENFEINESAIYDFVAYDWRDRRGTFWNNVHDFPPGCFAWVGQDRQLDVQSYWELPAHRLKQSDISFDQASASFRDIFQNAIDIRLRADVPVAFELSGGMDSSSIVGLAAKSHDIRTYTVKFPQKEADEESFARLVAEKYREKIDYRVIVPEQHDFWQGADRFVWMQEEPFHSPNLYTNHLLRRQIKSDGAKVVITGSAGDEVLAGYAEEYLPPFLRHLLGRGDVLRFCREITSNTEFSAWSAAKLLLNDSLLSNRYRTDRQWAKSGEGEILKQCFPARDGGHAGLRYDENSFTGRSLSNLTDRKMNYWLRSGNKSNFSIPLEGRAPFLDYRLVDFAARLPPEYLISGGWHKYILRKSMEGVLPDEVIWRKIKMGFPFPHKEWLAASRRVVEANLRDLQCPYVREKPLFNHYEKLTEIAPMTLWRLISVGLWWKRVIRGEPLLAQPG